MNEEFLKLQKRDTEALEKIAKALETIAKCMLLE